MAEVIITEGMASSQIFLMVAVIRGHGLPIEEYDMNMLLGRRAHKHETACTATANQQHLNELRNFNLEQLTIGVIP